MIKAFLLALVGCLGGGACLAVSHGGAGASYAGVSCVQAPSQEIWTYAITRSGECWRSTYYGEGVWTMVSLVGPPATGQFCSISAVAAPDSRIWVYAITDTGECWRSTSWGESEWSLVATVHPIGTGLFTSISVRIGPSNVIWAYAVTDSGECWRSTSWGEGAWSLISTISPTSGQATIDPSLHGAKVEPNPGPGSTRVRFTLERGGRETVLVFDSGGRRVRTLFDGLLSAGPFSLLWDGKDDKGADVASGVYFARFGGTGRAASARIILAR